MKRILLGIVALGLLAGCGGSSGGGSTAQAQEPELTEPVDVIVQEPLKVITAETDANQIFFRVTSFATGGFANLLDGPAVIKAVTKLSPGGAPIYLVPFGSSCAVGNKTLDLFNLGDNNFKSVYFLLAATESLCYFDAGTAGGGTVWVAGYVPY